MQISIFCSVWIDGEFSQVIKDYFLSTPLRLLTENQNVTAVEYYEPYANDLPPMDGIPPPDGIIEINVKTIDAARDLVQSNEFESLFIKLSELRFPVNRVHLELFETVHYPIPKIEQIPLRTAQLSFVVRYYGQPHDQAEFADFYTKNHPPLLAKFPNIRNVICYVPLDVGLAGRRNKGHTILGNEVVFDDLDALSDALDSDVMSEVMADSAAFPTFGHSSHHVMLRSLVHACGTD